MYDVLIIGGGPAGATAAIYTARAGLETALVYKDSGALAAAERVENYYGVGKIGGKSLVERGLRQARKFGAKTVRGEVLGLRSGFVAQTTNGEFTSRTVITATGVSRSIPQIPGISDYEGRGVSYCAICDGFFYRGKHVAVLGSGAFALHEAADLLPLAASVTILTNGAAPAVDFPDAVKIRTEKVAEIIGETPENATGFSLMLPQKILIGAVLQDGEKIPLSGLFIAEGTAGAAELARKIGAEISGDNVIKTDAEMRTSVPGVWAAGDCTGGTTQIIKAANDGASAALSIIKFLRG